ncbi:hypothetical protein WMF37_03590 [Sorangium sp. So ce291]|uniref:hypothetical protein n=1 Tax=unclassified Sorangium TaxID=2621164 RepID=UPI003F10FC87
MMETDPVEDRLAELRRATEGAAPPEGFDERVWSEVDRRARRLSPWLALVPAAAAAFACVLAAWRLDARLAERVLVVGADEAVEAP